MLEEYIAYLKDNPKGYWFKAKLFGWGWVPVTWQGWLTLAVFIVLLVANTMRLDVASGSDSDTLLNFIPQTLVLIILLLLVCRAKGEKPHWQWGIPKDKKDTDSEK